MGDELLMIPARIKELRTDLGLTQKDFAEFINVSTVSVSSYETGAKTPSLDMIINIARKCKVSIDWLCGLSNTKSVDMSIENYKDIIRLLLNLENAKIDGFSCKTSIDSYGLDICEVEFFDHTIFDFCSEWQKMSEMHKKNIVDDELYDLWIEKTMKKYDKPIERSDFMNIPDGLDEELPFN